MKNFSGFTETTSVFATLKLNKYPWKGMMDCSEDSSLKRAWNDVRELNSNEFKSLEKESIDFINQMC